MQDASLLVPAPENGRVFTQQVRSGFADCAPSGRVRLDALARWLQDVAYADVEDAGLADAAVWVVRRTHLRVHDFPRFAERLHARTFCSGLGRMWAERSTTLSREGSSNPAVEAVSLWVHLDPVSWRPAPFSAQEIASYQPSAGDRRVTARLRHPHPPADGTPERWSFRASELDIASHINNAAYFAPLEEELLQQPDPPAIEVEVEYRTPASAGVKLLHRDGSRRWVSDEDGEVHASFVIGA